MGIRNRYSIGLRNRLASEIATEGLRYMWASEIGTVGLGNRWSSEIATVLVSEIGGHQKKVQNWCKK